MEANQRIFIIFSDYKQNNVTENLPSSLTVVQGILAQIPISHFFPPCPYSPCFPLTCSCPHASSPQRRFAGDVSTNENAGFRLISAPANQRRELNVISGTSTNRKAGLGRLTNESRGDWGRQPADGRGRCLSLVFRRSVYTRTSQHSKVEANTASLKRMFMDPTDFVQYLALSLQTRFYIPSQNIL